MGSDLIVVPPLALNDLPCMFDTYLMNQLIFRHLSRSRPLKSPSALLLNALNSLSYLMKLEEASLALFGFHLLHIGDQVFF